MFESRLAHQLLTRHCRARLSEKSAKLSQLPHWEVTLLDMERDENHTNRYGLALGFRPGALWLQDPLMFHSGFVSAIIGRTI